MDCNMNHKLEDIISAEESSPVEQNISCRTGDTLIFKFG